MYTCDGSVQVCQRIWKQAGFGRPSDSSHLAQRAPSWRLHCTRARGLQFDDDRFPIQFGLVHTVQQHARVSGATAERARAHAPRGRVQRDELPRVAGLTCPSSRP
jgi:hypothetical protein